MHAANSNPIRPRSAGPPRDDRWPWTADAWRAASRSGFDSRATCATNTSGSVGWGGSLGWGFGVEFVGAPFPSSFTQGRQSDCHYVECQTLRAVLTIAWWGVRISFAVERDRL